MTRQSYRYLQSANRDGRMFHGTVLHSVFLSRWMIEPRVVCCDMWTGSPQRLSQLYLLDKRNPLLGNLHANLPPLFGRLWFVFVRQDRKSLMLTPNSSS